MRPWAPELAGRLEELEITSEALAGNPLGDSARRPLLVYVPPSYDADPARSYPVVYVLQGFAKSVASWSYPPSTFEATYPENADALFRSGTAPECLICFVDGWTSLGGSQFLDSPAVGRYHSYLVNDVVSFVDDRFRTVPEALARGIQGHSSGGYGALVTAMKRPDLFGAIAAHAPDGAFDLSMRPLLATAYRALRDEYEGDYERWWTEFHSRRPFSKGSDFTLLECLAMAACYSPREPGPAEGEFSPRAVELPFEPAGGRLRQEVWQRWLSFDPVEMAPHHLQALSSMKGIWLEAGRSDEHFLDVAVDHLAAVLQRAGIDHHYELFAGGHRHPEHRFPAALAYLAEAIAVS